MSSDTNALPPSSPRTSGRSRQTGIDVARGLAVAGMVLVNFDLTVTDGGGPAWVATFVEAFQGRASALFVVLAGVGLGMLARSRGAAARSTVARRGLVLLIAGSLLFQLWPADILHFYGLWFLMAAPALFLTARSHAALAAAATLAFPLLLLVGVDYERHWNFETLDYGGMQSFDGIVRHALFNGFHPTLPWIAFLFAGLALSQRLTDTARSAWPLAAVAGAVAALAEVLAASLAARTGPDVAPLLDSTSMPPGPTYVVAAGATAICVLAASVQLCRSAPRTRASAAARSVLESAGRTALSLYVLHVVLGIVPLFLVTDEDLGPRMARGQGVLVSATWCTVFFLLAHLLRMRSRTGPFEALFRRLAP